MGVETEIGVGDGRLKLLSDSLFNGRDTRSKAGPDSCRDGECGAGEDGRLEGRRKAGVLMACIIGVKGIKILLLVFNTFFGVF